jgi:hypothetical protein
MTSNGSGNLTFKWLTGGLIGLLMIVGGTLLADQRSKINDVKAELAERGKTNLAKIECLEREKLDKDLYYRDIREIKESLKEQAETSQKIMDKLEKIRMIR